MRFGRFRVEVKIRYLSSYQFSEQVVVVVVVVVVVWEKSIIKINNLPTIN